MRALSSWTQDGAVFVWRYVTRAKHYPGWHLATDARGHASLLDLLQRLRAAGGRSAVATVKTTHPSAAVLAVVGNHGGRPEAPALIHFEFDASSDQWKVIAGASDVRVQLGSRQLDAIIVWLSDPDAAFDSTSGSTPPLWFWGIA
jgi:hypothetical protein